MTPRSSRFFDIRPGEAYRVGVMAALFFLLLAANNLIKILRDTIFLGQHSVSELPYLYIFVAFLAGVIIATYTRYTANLSLVNLIIATNAVIVSTIIVFWFLLIFFNPGWSHYAFYIWSATVNVIAISQLWTLANQLFSPDEGKRLFGLLAAGGTLGGAVAGFGTQWTVHLSSIESTHLLWVLAGLYLSGSVLVASSYRRLMGAYPEKALESSRESNPGKTKNTFALLADSRYLKTIATVILVSVIISTLIDFQFKAAAKETYPSKAALAGFFSSYYGWLSVATFFAQIVLTGKALTTFGLNRSLYLTPSALLAGSLAIMIWPSLLAATLTRMADATLRHSIHRSSMEIVYMGVPTGVMKAVKPFLDVVFDRVGDASAGFIILLFSLSLMASYKTYVHFVCVALIFVWIVLIPFLRNGYSEALRKGLVPHDLPLKDQWLSRVRTKGSLGD